MFFGGVRGSACKNCIVPCIVRSLQDIMVEFNIVKLEVNYVRHCVYKTEDHLVDLEKQRLELQSAIKKRLELVASHRHRLITQRRNVESERMRLSMEHSDRLAQLDRLRKRYHAIIRLYIDLR